MKRWIPLVVTLVLAIWAAGGLRAPKDPADGFAASEFGRLPVVHNGRFQPLDSLGRNALLQLREKQTANLEPWKGNYGRPKIISASEWLMAMMMNPTVADAWPIFRIDHPDLKGLLALPMDADEGKQTDGKHFTRNQLQTKFKELSDEQKRAGQVKDELRNPYDKAVIKLSNQIGIYMRLQNTIQPQNANDWPKEVESYLAAVGPGVAAARAQQAGTEFDKPALDRLMGDLQRFDVMGQLEPALVVPAHEHDGPDGGHAHEWMRMGETLMGIARGEAPHFAITAYARMAGAYKAGDATAFNQAVRDYRTALEGRFGGQLKKAAREQQFNVFEPFYRSMTIYVLAGVCALVFWVRPRSWEWLRRTAVWLVLLALAVHTAGLVWRMVLEGRPPVTNLYSSAIFIGWGACVLGLILEWFWKNGIGVVISSVVGFITLIIAHHLSLTGDTMEMMRAVLDTNFWLATHVVIITLGYSSTFVAGFLAIIYVVRGVFTAGLDAPTAKSLGKMVYGIVCFATLFSFVGTVLGGIWADQSWGRFWGWDPKENGALIIVLWNALILHARWGGLVRERGLMNLAIGGNIVTAWSWFGVNMLGIGLHSYGFMDAAFRWLMAFVVSQLVIIALGSLPPSWWRSFRSGGGQASPPTGGAPQPA